LIKIGSRYGQLGKPASPAPAKDSPEQAKQDSPPVSSWGNPPRAATNIGLPASDGCEAVSAWILLM
jgi:hypothetical protein